jgi:cystathionine gamma-synthase
MHDCQCKFLGSDLVITRKLAKICEAKFGVDGELCLLTPTLFVAQECRYFIIDQSSKASAKVPVRIAHFIIRPESNQSGEDAELHIVLFPSAAFPFAKAFWQHTGLGISSRYAEYCLSMLPEEPASATSPTFSWSRLSGKLPNKHYTAKERRISPPPLPADVLTADQSVYLEERYGRNLPQGSDTSAKRALRRRIADVLVHDTQNYWDSAGNADVELGPSSRGVADVTEDDVFLYPSGMSSIWCAHHLARATRPAAKSAAFG